jgi:hypothetical protein
MTRRVPSPHSHTKFNYLVGEFDPALGQRQKTFDASNREVCLNCIIPYGCDENNPLCRLVKRHYSRKPDAGQMEIRL